MAVKQTQFTDFGTEPEPERRPQKKRAMPKRDFEQLLTETNALKDRQAWSEFTPKHFVGLYCLLHQHVYKVVPDEVRDQFRPAVGASMRMLKHEFSGEQLSMVDFMRWTWRREEYKDSQRDRDSDFRIGWRLQFGRPLLSDYRVAQARRRTTRRRTP
jgi:hypothetical protein